MARILIVEDDIHLQLLLKDELHEDGHEIITAANGREALDVLNGNRSERPDLIIMDVRMPKMDGLETMGYLLKSRQNTPVIIYSAYASYRHDVMAMAADAYVVKSHDITELKTKIHELLHV